MAKINGTNARDLLRGGGMDDVILARGGNDRLFGNGGDDVLNLGTGIDRAIGGAGNDRFVISELDSTTPDGVFGNGGLDTLDLSHLALVSFLSPTWEFDADTKTYSVRSFFRDGPAVTFDGIERLIGSNTDDSFYFYDAVKGLTIDGGAGGDWINAGVGNDTISGGLGDDTIRGGGGRDVLLGGGGDDDLSIGYDGTGMIDGGAGVDVAAFYDRVDMAAGIGRNGLGQRVTFVNIEDIDIEFRNAGGLAFGDDRNNVIDADFSFVGGTLSGRSGDDTLIGGREDDRLIGGDGDDLLKGGDGSDMLGGGRGADRFQSGDFFGTVAGDGQDTILDFRQSDHDLIDLTQVDPNPDTFETEDFVFIGHSAFGHVGGQVRYDLDGGDTIVEADIDGDAVADISIRLIGNIALVARDFAKVENGALIDGGAKAQDDLVGAAGLHHAAHAPLSIGLEMVV